VEERAFFDRKPLQCTFPVGDLPPGPGMLCCGAAVEGGGALFRFYCEKHRKKAAA
jgi:hypothetical protein